MADAPGYEKDPVRPEVGRSECQWKAEGITPAYIKGNLGTVIWSVPRLWLEPVFKSHANQRVSENLDLGFVTAPPPVRPTDRCRKALGYWSLRNKMVQSAYF